jgi:hypothetical protein
MLERTDGIINEVLEPITFVLSYHTVLSVLRHDGVKACRRRLEHPNALTSALRHKWVIQLHVQTALLSQKDVRGIEVRFLADTRTSPKHQTVSGAHTVGTGGKLAGGWVKQTSHTDVKKKCSYTSTPPYAFIACAGTNFPFPILLVVSRHVTPHERWIFRKCDGWHGLDWSGSG